MPQYPYEDGQQRLGLEYRNSRDYGASVPWAEVPNDQLAVTYAFATRNRNTVALEKRKNEAVAWAILGLVDEIDLVFCDHFRKERMSF